MRRVCAADAKKLVVSSCFDDPGAVGCAGGAGSVEAGAGGVGVAVVADGDGFDLAEVDVAPNGGAVVVGIDDLQVPDAAGGGVAEGDVGGFAIGDGGLAQDVLAPSSSSASTVGRPGAGRGGEVGCRF